MVRFDWLGSPRVLKDGLCIHIERRRALGILVYLSVRSLPAAREELKALFWPEADTSGASRSLRTALSEIRKKLPGILTDTRNDTLSLDRDLLECDIGIFHRYVDHAKSLEEPEASTQEYSRAASLWRGSFLQGFNIRASYRFDDWMQLLSESLRNDLINILEPLTELYMSSGRFGAARSTLYTWLDIDPLDETAQRLVMKTCLASGDRAEALQQFNRFCKKLDEELGLSPSPESIKLAEEIRKPGIETIPMPQMYFKKTFRLAGRFAGPQSGESDGRRSDLILSQALKESFSRRREVVYIDPVDIDGNRDNDTDLTRLGRRLGTRYVLDSSFRNPSQNRQSLNMNLTDAIDGGVLWDKNSPIAAPDLPALAGEITEEIIRRLAGTTAGPLPSVRESPDSRAWRLQGVHYRRYGKPEDLIKSIDCFNKAGLADPANLRATSDKALSYACAGAFGTWVMPPDEAYGLARDLSREVLEESPGDSIALLTQATVESEYDRNPLLGLRDTRLALVADNNNPEILIQLAQTLQGLWRREEALEAARSAYLRDPADHCAMLTLHSALRATRRFRECLEIDDRFETLYPGRVHGPVIRSMTYSFMGDNEKACAIMAPLLPVDPDAYLTPFIGNLGYFLGRAGRTPEADSLLSRMEKQYRIGALPPYPIAFTLLGLHRIPECLDWLEMAEQRNDTSLSIINFNPEWEELLPHPRFRALCRKMGVEDLPEEHKGAD